MLEFVTEDTLLEYETFVQSNPKGHFAQSCLWAHQKPMWEWDAVLVRRDVAVKGTLAFLTRRAPGMKRTLMYGCRGPVCDIHDRETFAELMNGAKALARKKRAFLIRLDPDVPSSDKDFCAMLASFGFRGTGGKNFETIQPRYVFRLNLAGKTEDELLAGFHKNGTTILGSLNGRALRCSSAERSSYRPLLRLCGLPGCATAL